MKFLLICALLFLLVSMLLGAARGRGRMSEQANRAVTGLANSLRIFIYGLLVAVVIVCAAVAWEMISRT